MRRAIATERLSLEPVADAHIPELLKAIESSLLELERWMTWAINWEPEESEAYLRNIDNPHEIVFAMVHEGVAVGTISLLVRPLPGWAEVGYWIRSDRCGKGLTTEALRGLAEWAFTERDLHRLELQAGKENHGSNRVAEKAGFSRCGARREAGRGVDGWYDCNLWERVAIDRTPLTGA